MNFNRKRSGKGNFVSLFQLRTYTIVPRRQIQGTTISPIPVSGNRGFAFIKNRMHAAKADGANASRDKAVTIVDLAKALKVAATIRSGPRTFDSSIFSSEAMIETIGSRAAAATLSEPPSFYSRSALQVTAKKEGF